MAEEQEVDLRNVRGKAKLAFLGRTRVGKLLVTFRDGVAIGPNSTELSALAGRLGRDANLLLFHFLNWPLVDIEYKDRVMMEIKEDPERDAPSGIPAVRLEIFERTRTRKDKLPINELDKEKMMKELANKVTEDGLSMYSTGHDDIFTQFMGPDSLGRKWCFGRATF
ncbi:Uncharacterized protein Fot_19624 [Forsythia ovata]|uniref:Uncharacterized protein n=1 Tax=Forsythia ovata TaxID=205694 RepID=A0ABD1VNL4_9LAMI